MGDAPLPEQQLANLKKRLSNNKEEQKLIVGNAIEPNYTLLGALLEGTLEWQKDIDTRIGKLLSENWKRERMSPVLIAILQCAIFELLFHKDAKPVVIVSEYTSITGRFFSDNEVNFVHGALKTLVKSHE